MKVKHLYLLLVFNTLLSSLSLELHSQPVSTFKFQKDITLGSTGENEWGFISLDEEVYRNSYFQDLRILEEGRLIPFRREAKTTTLGKKGSVVPKIIFQSSNSKESIYVIEVPSIPRNSRLTNMDIRSATPFESNVTIQLGTSPDNWTVTKSGFFFQYNFLESNSENTIQINAEYYPFIRITTDSYVTLQFPRVNYGSSNLPTELRFELDTPDPVRDTENQSLVYYYPNENRIPFHKIQLEFTEKAFRRSYILSAMNDSKEYSVISSGTLERKAPNLFRSKQLDSTEINLSEAVKSSWKLEILHGDNKPLQLEKTIALHPQERLVFSLLELNNSPNPGLKLYYGNRYATLVDFDLSGFPTELSEDINEYSLGAEVMNPQYSWSFFHPPLSTWITRFLFLLGLGIVGIFTYSILRRFNESGQSMNNE